MLRVCASQPVPVPVPATPIPGYPCGFKNPWCALNMIDPEILQNNASSYMVMTWELSANKPNQHQIFIRLRKFLIRKVSGIGPIGWICCYMDGTCPNVPSSWANNRWASESRGTRRKLDRDLQICILHPIRQRGNSSAHDRELIQSSVVSLAVIGLIPSLWDRDRCNNWSKKPSKSSPFCSEFHDVNCWVPDPLVMGVTVSLLMKSPIKD